MNGTPTDHFLVFVQPYARLTDVHHHATWESAHSHYLWLTSHGHDASRPVQGTFSRDEVLAELRNLRTDYVRRLAHALAERTASA